MNYLKTLENESIFIIREAYQRWYRAGCDCGDVWFHMTHADFSEVISRTASSINCFIDNAQEEFYANEEKLKKEYESKLARKTKRKKTV